MKTLFLLFLITTTAQAEVLLKDIGIIGLMSHDIFAWDHKREENTENGRLDLSTIFDYEGGARWKKGGNPKNGENSPVWTVTNDLVNFYTKELKSKSAGEARKNTVIRFHAQIKESFTRITGLAFPVVGMNENVTNVEQAALRGLHDILPGKVQVYGRVVIREFALTNFLFAKFELSEREMNQVIPFFNGDYADEYKAIKIPFSRKIVNLKEVDGAFIEKWSPFKQEEMLRELAEVGEGSRALGEVTFMGHISDLAAKAICPEGNKWMPQEVACQ